jgi:EpsI family protein
MTAVRIKALVVMLLMVVAYGAAAAWKPTRHLADMKEKVSLAELFPVRFGDWVQDTRVPVQLVSPDQVELLNKLYNETLSRTYVNRSSGERIMLSVAYGGDQSEGTRAHLPEVCYPAQGFQIMSRQRTTFTAADRAVPVQQLLTKLGGRIEPVSYWVVVGERVALSGPQQKLAQLAYSVRGIIPDGTLVRVSNIDADAAKSYALHESFVREMAAAIPQDRLTRVVGGGES